MSTHCNRIEDVSLLSRREALRRAGAGFGMVALGGLLNEESLGNPGTGVLPQLPARAKRIIWLFMGGGVSHVDSFDPKPILQKYHREKIPMKLPSHLRDGSDKVLASPFKFQQYGQAGLPVSELFPHMAKHADKLCVLRSMYCDSIDHTGATLQTFCGAVSLPRPGIGNWLLYGLGTENQNLPGYVVMGPDQQSGTATYSPRFLPTWTSGTRVNWDYKPNATAHNALPNLRNAGNLTVDEQRAQLALLKKLNGAYAADRAQTDPLSARTQSYELAFRMQAAAPEAFDITGETEVTKKMYGLDEGHSQSFGYRCLLARRLAERGVRFIQVQCGKGDGLDWDQHGELEKGHRKNAAATDKPVGALLADHWTTRSSSGAVSLAARRPVRAPTDANIIPTATPSASPGPVSAADIFTVQRMSSAGTPPRNGCTSTTFTRRCCTSWVSTTRNSRTATADATSG